MNDIPSLFKPLPNILMSSNFEHTAALFFLPEGHYLFRYCIDEARQSKFVTAADVTAAFSGQDQDSGWLSPGIVRCGYNSQGDWFVYTTPAQKVTVHILEAHGLGGENTPVASGCTFTFPIPRLVLVGIGSTFALWALKSHNFDPQATAYLAPFPNIHPNGRICWGQNTPPLAHHQAARKVWELFFQSPFNGDLASGKSMSSPEDVRRQLIRLAVRRTHLYPKNDLIPVAPYPPTIAHQIAQLLGE